MRIPAGIAFVVFSALSLCALGAQAQAPAITPAGDPSIKPDTIYKLAVDPASQPQDDVVYLLDDAVVKLDANGRGTKTYRQIVQVLRQQAVAGMAERRLRYSPGHEKLTLNWARVLRPTGEVISDKPAQMQESDVPAALANPVYVQQKEVRLSLGGVAPNTIIDLSFTVEELQPYLQGDFYTHWNVHSTAAVSRSRFILDVPAAVQPRITERNLNFAVQKWEGGGRRAFTWATANVPRYRAEPFSPDTNSVQMHIVTSLPVTWAGVARWYHDLSRDRYTLTPDVQSKVRELVAGGRTRLDTIRALHRWAAQDIRYVSVSLGLGGYQPRPPDQTVTTGFGDCKDKATLFIAALRLLGLEAHPVLLHTNAAAVRPAHPSIRQFNHMIAAVREGSGYTFTDLTAGMTPYGELPVLEQGGFAVVVLRDGRAQEVTLPKMSPDVRRITYSIVATISDAGELSGYMEETNTGFGFEGRRILFGAPLDSARKATVMRGLLGIIPGAVGDSIEAFNGRDLYAPVRYKVHFSRGRGVAQSGGLELFTFPFGVLPASDRIRQLEAMSERKTSINAEEVLRAPPPTTMTVDMRITLPAGRRARVPNDVIVKSDFGTYSTEYSQEGQVLRILRTERANVGVYPPSRLADVIQFFRAISADENNRTIVIERG
jgi:uncharacterized protein DUF3857/transglutaminase superfamily protein